MSVLSDLVRALIASGATSEAITAAIEVVERHQDAASQEEVQRVEERRRRDRERKRRSRAVQELRREVAVRILNGEPVNPRALGINPRALGTNPRARLK